MKTINDALDLYSAEQYEEAFELLDAIERKSGVTPATLLWKSRCLQLTSSEALLDSSADVDELLTAALELDRDYVPAIIALGYFYLLVEDDAERALPLFRRAQSICTENATEVVVGIGECLIETESPREALNFLGENASFQLDSVELEKLKDEIHRVHL